MNTTTASISGSVSRMTDTIFTYLPRIAAALLIILATLIVVKVVRRIITKMLLRIDLEDKAKARSARPSLAPFLERVSLNRLVANVVGWLIWLAGVSLALNTLQIPRLDDAVAGVWSYVPNVLGALLILIVAMLVAGAIAMASRRFAGDTALGKIVATVMPALILTIAGFMALVQLELATPIVVGAFYITLGAVALGLALAFGLGGRSAAEKMLEKAYERAEAEAPRIREEAHAARERASEDAERLKQKAGAQAA